MPIRRFSLVAAVVVASFSALSCGGQTRSDDPAIREAVQERQEAREAEEAENDKLYEEAIAYLLKTPGRDEANLRRKSREWIIRMAADVKEAYAAEERATNNAQAHCKGKSRAARRRDAQCLFLDCPGFLANVYAAASEGNIRTGMDACLVRAAWGEPDDIHSTITAGSRSEQWVYDSQYIYFDDGYVTTIQN